MSGNSAPCPHRRGGQGRSRQFESVRRCLCRQRVRGPSPRRPRSLSTAYRFPCATDSATADDPLGPASLGVCSECGTARPPRLGRGDRRARGSGSLYADAATARDWARDSLCHQARVGGNGTNRHFRVDDDGRQSHPPQRRVARLGTLGPRRTTTKSLVPHRSRGLALFLAPPLRIHRPFTRRSRARSASHHSAVQAQSHLPALSSLTAQNDGDGSQGEPSTPSSARDDADRAQDCRERDFGCRGEQQGHQLDDPRGTTRSDAVGPGRSPSPSSDN
jgi:hypothetical protein